MKTFDKTFYLTCEFFRDYFEAKIFLMISRFFNLILKGVHTEIHDETFSLIFLKIDDSKTFSAN